MVSWSLAGRRSALAILAASLGRAGRRAYADRRVVFATLRLLTRFVLILASIGLTVAAVAILAGAGWALLAGGFGCAVLEWIVKDGSGTAERRRAP